MTSIKIHNVSREDDAQPLVRALQGQSYLNLEVRLCPIGGSFDVNVVTLRPETTAAELTEVVLGIIAFELCKANRAYEFDQHASKRPF